MTLRKSIIFFTTVLVCTGTTAQDQFRPKMTREEYILQYKDIAISQMLSSGIPASITLAQACLESSNGNSGLAVEGNNHFGIKCHGWAGDSIKIDDDELDECFRKYDNPEQSFLDHSDFLRTRSRYATLFELEKTDYTGWAHGLKAAGYATSPTYAEDLIRIIEENNLFAFDHINEAVPCVETQSVPAITDNPAITKQASSGKHDELSLKRSILKRNGVHYILAEQYDTFGSIASEYGLFYKELLYFNDLDKERRLTPGEPVYLERKRRKSPRQFGYHISEEGETLYDISQQYAVKLKSLCTYNNLAPDSELAAGSLVKLRK